jgi:hypothetical protein
MTRSQFSYMLQNMDRRQLSRYAKEIDVTIDFSKQINEIRTDIEFEVYGNLVKDSVKVY